MAEKKPAKGKVPNILTPDVPAISAKPRSLKDKFQPAPLTNNLGNDPENLSKIEEIRHLARQREAQAKTLGPNYKPEKNVESTANPVVSTEDGKITYSPSDLARKYSLNNRSALNTPDLIPSKVTARKIKESEARTYGRIVPVVASDLASRQVRTVGRAFEGTPEQLEARKGLSAAAYERQNANRISNARQVHSAVFPGHPFPGLTEHENMLARREAAIKTANAQRVHSNLFPDVPWPGLEAHTQMVNDLKSNQSRLAELRTRQLTEKPKNDPIPQVTVEKPTRDSGGFRGFAPKPEMLTLTPEQIAKHGVDTVNKLMKTHDVHVQLEGQHIARLVNVDEELTHTPSGQQIKRFVPLNSEGMEMGPNALKPTRPSYLMEGEVQNPLYRHGVSLFNKYAPKSKRFPFGDNLDNVDPTSKANWVREHLRDKVVPALYPDNEAAAYKDIMNHPDKIVDVFEEHHTKQKAFESAHRKGGVLPTLPTGKLDPVTGEEKRRPPRSVHTLNKEIQRLRNSNLPYTGPQLDDPEDVRRQRAADKQALRDSSDISGFSEQNTSPETVAQSPEEAKGSKMREAGRAPLEL
jgi:hypothetical protein